MPRTRARQRDLPKFTRRQMICTAIAASGGLLLPLRTYAQLAGFDYYIGPNGNNANPGTAASPWAISALGSKPEIAGKRVGLLDGTYVVMALSGGNNGGIHISANNVTIRAVNPRRAIITTNNGGSYPQDTAPVFQIAGDGITLDAIRFYQFSFDPIRVAGHNCSILNCDFADLDLNRYTSYSARGSDNVGFIITAANAYPDNLLIDSCRFDGAWNGSHGQNGNLIGPLYYAGRTTIRRCSFYNAFAGIGWKSYNRGPLIVQECYFDSTLTDRAVYGGMGNDYVVPMLFEFKHNVVNRTGAMLDGWDINTPDSEVHSDIQWNTFIMDSSGDAFGFQGIAYSNGFSGAALSGSNLHGCKVRNNLFVSVSGSSPILFRSSSGGRNSLPDLLGDIDYNLYSRISMRDGGTTHTTLASWRSALTGPGIVGAESHSVVATPTFVNLNGNTAQDFRLANGSAGKNSASDGSDLGAWGAGVSEIGSSFSAVQVVAPQAPQLVTVL